MGDALWVNAQTATGSGHEPDVLILIDGEKLIGHFEKSIGRSATFKSDLAGEVTVDWNKVKELHTSGKFAVVKKDTKLRWRHQMDIPQGSISLADQKIQIQAEKQPEAVSVPVGNISEVIDQATFEKAVLQKPGISEGWKGSATLGIALVNATQSSQSYTSSVSLQRRIPTENWLDPSSRTSFNFTSAYGQLTQPNTPEVKTSLFHAEGERDQYFRSTLYGFASAGFDHDYSQGLDLQQTYGGGVGWTVAKSGNAELDLKGELTFVDQQFSAASSNQRLLGSIFSENYDHSFKRKIVLHQQINLDPAWTILRDYSATATVSLSIPVLKRMSFTITTADEYLNDPSPGFRKNSYQFSTGLTYTLP